MHVEKNKDTSDTCDIYLSIKMHVFGIMLNEFYEVVLCKNI